MDAAHDGSAAEASRWVELAGIDNVRDLGGLPVEGGGSTRRGVVFRGSTLQGATEADVELLMEGLRLRTVVDLRNPHESAREGHGLLADTAVRRANLPVSREEPAVTDAVPDSQDVGMAAFYHGLLQGSGPSLTGAARIVADTDQHAVVFHCAVGKDRTGVCAAVLLDAVGVAAEVIAADYALTAQRVARIRARLLSLGSYRDLPAVDHGYMAAEPEAMLTFLTTLHTDHGGAAEWLLRQGLTEAELERLRDALVEP
ncbi:tyrosine-protein phosphatase [Streptomyces sp. NPDC058001]|uniref:tyrosine-protein phosphatase n=1 Tax=Streptomyces sp. NPDC058001 TaxID=3346300 RepID=UPI0036E4F6DF